MSVLVVAIWVISSAGRAPPLQGGGRQFDPVITHQFLLFKSNSNADW